MPRRIVDPVEGIPDYEQSPLGSDRALHGAAGANDQAGDPGAADEEQIQLAAPIVESATERGSGRTASTSDWKWRWTRATLRRKITMAAAPQTSANGMRLSTSSSLRFGGANSTLRVRPRPTPQAPISQFGRTSRFR